MVRKLLLFVLAATALCAAQGQRIGVASSNSSGFLKVIPGASITVCVFNIQSQCTNPVSIFSDSGLHNALPNPFHADGNGNYQYYAANGTYLEKVCSATSGACSIQPVTFATGADLASPPPIGNVTPNAITATDLTATGTVTVEAAGTATSVTGYGSENFILRSSYWDGSAAAAGTWTCASVEGSGALPAGKLVCTYLGSVGRHTVSFPSVTTQTANAALGGFLSLAVPDTINWRNNSNNGDLLLGVTGSDALEYNTHPFISVAGNLDAGLLAATTAVAPYAALGIGGTGTGANCLIDTAPVTWATCAGLSGGSGTVNAGTATHFAYYASSTDAVNDMGSDFTFLTHTLTGGASAILDMHSMSTSALKLPGGLGTGVVTVTTSTGAISSATGTQGQTLGYGASGAPIAYTGRTFLAKEYNVVADGTDQCGANLNALIAAANANGGTILFDAGTTTLSTCNLTGTRKLMPNVILEGRGSATANETLATPPAVLLMNFAGTDSFHIDCLNNTGSCGARNLTVKDTATNLTFFLMTTVPVLDNVTCWGRNDRRAGQVPDNDCVWFGNFDGSDNPIVTCSNGNENAGFCEYGNVAMSHVNITVNNVRRAIRFGGNANGIDAYVRSNYSDAYVDGSLNTLGGLIQFKGGATNPSYGNTIEVHAEMANNATGKCNYKGAVELVQDADNNLLWVEASDLGSATPGVGCDYAMYVDDSTSNSNDIHLGVGSGNLGTVSDPSTTFNNQITSLPERTFSTRTITGLHFGASGSASAGPNDYIGNNAMVVKWNSGSTPWAANTGLSKISAGVLGIGDGTQGNITGALQLTSLGTVTTKGVTNIFVTNPAKTHTADLIGAAFAADRTYTIPDGGGNVNVQLSTGTLTSGNLAAFDANGNAVDSGVVAAPRVAFGPTTWTMSAGTGLIGSPVVLLAAPASAKHVHIIWNIGQTTIGDCTISGAFQIVYGFKDKLTGYTSVVGSIPVLAGIVLGTATFSSAPTLQNGPAAAARGSVFRGTDDLYIDTGVNLTYQVSQSIGSSGGTCATLPVLTTTALVQAY